MGFVTEERILSLRRNVCVSAHCDNCAKTLDVIHAGDLDEASGAADALEITLSGGYGQFFDDADVKVLFCGDCANLLLSAFPSIKRSMADQERF